MARLWIPTFIKKYGEYSEEFGCHTLPAGCGYVKIVGEADSVHDWEDWPLSWPQGQEEYAEYVQQGRCRSTPIRIINFIPE